MSKKAIGFFTATSIVISSMIGVGVFTSLGYQVADIKSGFALLLLWFIGGAAALMGALCYGELGAAFPMSGGEYNYLSKIYHPAVGFLSGWVSAIVGFSAPAAASSIALGKYLSQIIPQVSPVGIAAAVIILMAVIHTIRIEIGRGFQNFFTALNILIIIGIIVCGMISGRTGNAGFLPDTSSWEEIKSPAFAVSFFFVSLAYSGWNASAYIAGEMEDIQRNLPRSLILGTLLVMLLYMLLNFIFLYTTPMDEMAGKAEVGLVAAKHIVGNTGGKIMGLIISLLLLSSVSSMTIAGPRVTNAMGEDFHLFRFFSRKNKHGIPAVAIITQCIISLLFVFTAKFEQVITYISFTLNLFLFLTVLGLIVLRIKRPALARPYRTWGYPVTPVLFLIISAWLTYFGFREKPYESLAGLGTVLSGLFFYFVSRKNVEPYK